MEPTDPECHDGTKSGSRQTDYVIELFLDLILQLSSILRGFLFSTWL